MAEELTEEQKQAINEYFEKHSWPIAKRIKGLCIISIATGVFIAAALVFILVASSVELSFIEVMGFVVAFASATAIGVFGLAIMRNGGSVADAPGRTLRIAINVGIICNALALVAMLRDSSIWMIVPFFTILVCVTILSFVISERKLKRGRTQ